MKEVWIVNRVAEYEGQTQVWTLEAFGTQTSAQAFAQRLNDEEHMPRVAYQIDVIPYRS